MIRLPAGKYFIGDPCYAIRETKDNPDRWSDFCEALFATDSNYSNQELLEFEGKKMFAAGTAHGDGCYEGSDGFGYGVDAGLIGCVPLSLCNEKMKEMKRLGTIVEFKKPFDAERTGDYIFIFGHIEIPTNAQEPEDDYENTRH